MAEVKPPKIDYLEKAKWVYAEAKTFDSVLDQAMIKAAQTVATIAIAEELRRLNELLAKLTEPNKEVSLNVFNTKQ